MTRSGAWVCPRQPLDRFVVARRRDHLAAPLVQQKFQRLEHDDVVLDHQDTGQALVVGADRNMRSDEPGFRFDLHRDADGEDRSLAFVRPDGQRVVEQARQPVDDRQAKAEAGRVRCARRIAAIEFLEDDVELVRGNAGTGVPDLDPQLVALTAAAEQDPAVAGVAHRIGQQVAQDAFQQVAVAPDHGGAGRHMKRQPFLARRSREFQRHAGQEAVDRMADRLDPQRAGIDPGDVEMGVHKVLDRRQRRIHGAQDIAAGRVLQPVLQRPDEQRQGRQRLAQVMVGDGEEAAARPVGPFGLHAGLDQTVLQAAMGGDVLDGCQRKRASIQREPFGRHQHVDRPAVGQQMPPLTGFARMSRAPSSSPSAAACLRLAGYR